VIRRHGSDITIVTHSYMTRIALECSEKLTAGNISCEVVDLRSLAPLDLTTICASVGRTRALLTLEEGQATCGVGTEVAFRVREQLGEIRVARVGALAAPVSSNPILEAATLPMRKVSRRRSANCYPDIGEHRDKGMLWKLVVPGPIETWTNCAFSNGTATSAGFDVGAMIVELETHKAVVEVRAGRTVPCAHPVRSGGVGKNRPAARPAER
jgi:hypothetical protein